MRILLADDHRLLVEGLSNLLAAHGMTVVGIASDGRAAVLQALDLNPDLILMDLRMPVCNGLTATRMIKAQRPEIKVVILTTSAEDDDLFAAIQSGASGYLLKSISGKAFIDALHGLEGGVPPFSPGLAARILDEFARRAGEDNSPPFDATSASATFDTPTTVTQDATDLTPRQIEVLRLVAAGLTYTEVGQQLSLSERTVRYHMAEIMERLHLEHRSQVIAYAGKLGLMQ